VTVRRPDTVVLGYHAVSADWPSSLAVTPARLEEQVRWLLDHGYRGTTFLEAATTPGDRTFAVTFDDGYRSVLLEALPVLDRLGVPATLFPNIVYLDAEELKVGPALHRWLDSPFRSELESLTWDEVRELANRGWEIGSHTVTHPYLTRVSDDQLERELVESKRRLEQELGRPCETLAYPSGDHDERVMAAAERAGYRLAAALPRRLPSTPHPLSWPRISISRDDSKLLFRLKMSRVVRRLRRSRGWIRADDLRRRAGIGPYRTA
jgi:peptidoglycan/xylan/chitin deacetylase (PgdA/CDA1 family)